MSSNYAIRVQEVSKVFQLYNKPSDRLKEALFGRGKYSREVVALNRVSLNIPKGATVGLIGQNGSGKSTLLQIICNILSPTEGQVEVNGKIAALLELGSGFNPDFTGRENVYMSGTIMGLTREEIDRRFHEIEEFAEIGEFIHQPVKTYSSGMFLRLAFATAVHTDPDILVVDEALAVGDVRFQNKCFRKFKEFQQAGKTILFVTHTTELLVRHCDYAFLLHQGNLVEEGSPKDVVNTYLDLLYGKSTKSKSVHNGNGTIPTEARLSDYYEKFDPQLQEFLTSSPNEDHCIKRRTYNASEYRWGNREAEIVDYLVVSGSKYDHVENNSSDQLDVYMKVLFHRDTARPIYGLTIKTMDGVIVYGTNSRDVMSDIQERAAGESTIVKFSLVPRLVQGDYFISLGVAEDVPGEEAVPLDRRYDMIHLKMYHNSLGFGVVDLQMNVEEVMI
jgi:lipopolysaccharide transport system ATP-binding protein